jgi:hypothetical protein
MTASGPGTDNDPLRDPGDFSFVLGGPLFQLLRRSHLSGDALELAHRRTVAMVAIGWLPLLVLSALEGRLVGGSVAVPFLRDLEAHVRFLVVLPLLVAAELTVHQRVRFVTRQFLARGLIATHDRARFDEALASTMRLRNSIAAELVLIAFVYVVGVLVIWSRYTVLDASTWYATPTGAGRTLSLAGVWFAYVSLPLFQFLLLRWYYRIFIWVRFLWRLARLDLRLVPTHPDRLGGLGFLSLTSTAFAPLALAHGALVAAWMANRIFVDGAVLLDFKIEIIGVVLLVLGVVFIPLMVFTGKLFDVWARGELEYGPLAARYAHEYQAKWVTSAAGPTEPLLGNSDIRSLADLAGVYAVVQGMRFAPITRQALVVVVAATLAPIAPLLLTMMPLGELVRRVIGMVAA